MSVPLLVSTPRGKYDRLKASMDLPKSLEAPIAKGQKLGMVKVALDGKIVASAPLVAHWRLGAAPRLRRPAPRRPTATRPRRFDEYEGSPLS